MQFPQFQNLQDETCGPIMGGEGRLKKHTPGFEVAVCLMMLSKNLLFKTLGFQITNDFVWNSLTGLFSHSP